jgi:hypothetical protein
MDNYNCWKCGKSGVMAQFDQKAEYDTNGKFIKFHNFGVAYGMCDNHIIPPTRYVPKSYGSSLAGPIDKVRTIVTEAMRPLSTEERIQLYEKLLVESNTWRIELDLLDEGM